jgi:hypothetical protein
MKTHNRVKQMNGIDPQIQTTLNALLLRNIDRLGLNSGQRAAIVLVLLKPAKAPKRIKQRIGGMQATKAASAIVPLKK